MEGNNFESIHFPPPSGHHTVGLKVYRWERDVRLPRQGKSPLLSKRPLLLHVWYPTDDHCHLERLAEDLTISLDGNPIKSLMDEYVWTKFATVQTSSYKDAPISILLNEGSIPLVLFSHGVGMSHSSGLIWFEELASHGFVVAAVDHFGFAATTELHFDREQVLSLPMMEIRNIYHEDIKFVLDSLETKDWGDDISRVIDRNRIGIFGHSIGGGAAWQLLWQDIRLKAALSMDGFLTNRVFPKLNNFLTKPLLILFAEKLDAVDEPDFFPTECGPGKDLGDACSFLSEVIINASKIHPRISISSNFPITNVTNISIPHAGHFSFTSKVMLKDYLAVVIADESQSSEAIPTSEKQSAAEEEFKSPTIWDVVGIGDRTLDSRLFILFVRNLIVSFFKNNLS